MTFRLIRKSNGHSFPLVPGTTYTLGRDSDVDFEVADSGVSRRHVEVRIDGDTVTVKDLRSSLGTFINAARVAEGRLRIGDTLSLASIDFRLESTASASERDGADVSAAKANRGVAERKPSMPWSAPSGNTIVRPVVARPSLENNALRGTTSIRAVFASTASAAEKNAQKLELLLDVSKGLTKAIDIESLLAKISDYVFTTLDAERCAVLLVNDTGELVTRMSRDKRDQNAPAAVPRSIVQAVFGGKVAILSNDAAADDRFSGQSVAIQMVRSAICAPLITSEDEVLGVLYADSSFKNHRFAEADLDFLIGFAGIATVAIEHGRFSERIRKEMLARSNFERFFTPDLASRIANSADAVKLGGDKRRVAVMFTDIRGFTALAERLKADETATLLTEYFTEMVDCVFRHNGTLDKFIGDAVMAQWGAPVTASDDADKAMDTALDMMSALDSLNARWTLEGRPTLQIGVGLTFGEAFAGNIGSERRLEYTVIGDTVNIASRLCSAAKAGEILMSEELLAALKRAPRTVALPPMTLAGKSQPLPVFKVTRD